MTSAGRLATLLFVVFVLLALPQPALAAPQIFAPNPIDLAGPPASFTITGQNFADNGFGLPVANFLLDGVVLGQARATGLTGSTTLTVPFPTNATSLIGPLPGLSAGAIQVQVYNQSGSATWMLVASVTLTVTDTTSIVLNPIDLASPPASFTITGQNFADNGFGLPVANFLLGGVVLGQARATGLTGSTMLTVPFPTNATSLIGPLPGLSAGAIQVQVYNQSGSASWMLVASVTLTVADTTSIVLNPIDLAGPPASFTITGQNFADNGFGLPVANFLLGDVVLGQARATGLTGSTTLTVPFPTNATSLIGPLPGLAAGAVRVEVYNQTGSTSYALVGSTTLTVNDTRPCVPCVTGISPSPIDLASAPASFTITGQGFSNNGFGVPVVNFLSGSTVLGQARATGLNGFTTLTVPFPTNATSLIGPLPGLAAGAVRVEVYNQTGSTRYALVGSTTLTVNDTRPCLLCVTGISPGPIDLASAPASFTIAGQGFSNNGFGVPVVNFLSGSTVLGQARATGLNGFTTLTVPFPTNATSLIGPLPGLAAGAVRVEVYNQTGSTSYALVGSTTLAVKSSRPSQVTGNEEAICRNDPNVFFCENFEDRAVGPAYDVLTIPIYKNNGWAADTTNYFPDVVNFDQVDGNKALRIVTPANGVSGGSMDTTLLGGPHRTVYWRWYVKYSSNYVWSPIGTKHNQIPMAGEADNGIFNFVNNWGIDQPVITFALSAQCQDRLDCSLPPNMNGGFRRFNPNQWYCVEARLTANTGASATDGYVQGWIDSGDGRGAVQYWEYPNVNLKRQDRFGALVDNPRFDEFFIVSYWNCDADETCHGPQPPDFIDYTHPEMYRYMDAMIGSTARIGCLDPR